MASLRGYYEGQDYRLSDYGTLAAAFAAMGTDSGELVVTRPHTVSTAVSVPANVTVRFIGAGCFVKAPGGTVTFNGPGLEASAAQHIFKGFDIGDIKFAVTSPVVYPQWWGGKPDGDYLLNNPYLGTDNTIPFQSAIEAVRRAYRGGGEVYVQNGIYTFSGKLTIRGVSLTGASRSGTLLWWRSDTPCIEVTPSFIPNDPNPPIRESLVAPTLRNFMIKAHGANPVGTCNLNSLVVTRLTGPGFLNTFWTSGMYFFLPGTCISLNNSIYQIDYVDSQDQIRLKPGGWQTGGRPSSGAYFCHCDAEGTPNRFYRISGPRFDPGLVGNQINVDGVPYTVTEVWDGWIVLVTPDIADANDERVRTWETNAAVINNMNWTPIIYHAILVRSFCALEHIDIENVPGDGVRMQCHTPDNANNTCILDVKVTGVQGMGFSTHGDNANGGGFFNTMAFGCEGYGYREGTLLGNNYFQPLTEANRRSAYVGDPDAQVNGSSWYGAYEEGGQGGNVFAQYMQAFGGLSLSSRTGMGGFWSGGSAGWATCSPLLTRNFYSFGEIEAALGSRSSEAPMAGLAFRTATENLYYLHFRLSPIGYDRGANYPRQYWGWNLFGDSRSQEACPYAISLYNTYEGPGRLLFRRGFYLGPYDASQRWYFNSNGYPTAPFMHRGFGATVGTAFTLYTGKWFHPSMVGGQITIYGVTYTVAAVADTHHLTLSTPAPDQSYVAYEAPELYHAGDFAFNTDPTPGQPMGWINAIPGSPGGFHPVGYIGAPPINSLATDPTTANIFPNTYMVFKNTTTGEIRLWVNDGGVIKKSAPLT